MTMFVVILLFFVGVILIVKGGDWFVDAAVWTAKVSGIPKVIVGATIVSIATTMPEIIVSLIAAAEGNCGIAVGNAVGSVTANMGLILSLCAIFNPFVIRRKDYALKGALMVSATAILYLFCLGGSLTTFGAVLLIAVFAVFVYENILSARIKNHNERQKDKPDKKTVVINIIKFIAGTCGIVIGADLLVDNGSILADSIGVPEAVIGATVIAVGTSLPELVTTIASVLKKQGALSVGNIIGANIIDTTLIIPLCSLISGGSLTIPRQSYILDMPISLIIAAISVIPMILYSKLMRWQGIAMFSVYILYLVIMFSYFI